MDYFKAVFSDNTVFERNILMIDMIYNLRVGDIHAAEFSDEFNKLCIPFEELLSEEQIKSSTS